MIEPNKYKGTLTICTSSGELYDCVEDVPGIRVTLTFSFPRVLGVTGGRADVFFCGGHVGESFALAFCGTDFLTDTYNLSFSRGVCDLGSAVSVKVYIKTVAGEIGVYRMPTGDIAFTDDTIGLPDITLPPPEGDDTFMHSVIGVSAECSSDYILHKDAISLLAEREIRQLAIPDDVTNERFTEVVSALASYGISVFRRGDFFDTRVVNIHLFDALCDYIEGRGYGALEGELMLLTGLCPAVAASSLLDPIAQSPLESRDACLIALCMFMLPGTPHFYLGDAFSKAEVDIPIRRLSKLYRRLDTVRIGYLSVSHLDNDVLVFTRRRDGETVVCVINRSDNSYSVECNGGMSVVFGGRGYKNTHRLPAHNGVVLCVEMWRGEQKYLSFIKEN